MKLTMLVHIVLKTNNLAINLKQNIIRLTAF